MEKRFRALRLIGTIYKALGILAVVITIVASIGVCVMAFVGSTAMEGVGREMGIPLMVGAGWIGGIIGSVLVFLYGAIVSLALFAFGEAVFLLVSLEENTRATAMWIQRQMSSGPAAPAAQPHSPPPPPSYLRE